MRLRLSIRYRVLLVLVGVAVATTGGYLYLATKLFTEDKLAYVYDLNAALAEGLAEESDLYLGVTGDKLRALGMVLADSQRSLAEREAFADAFLKHEEEVVRVELYRLGGQGPKRLLVRANAAALHDMSIYPSDLESARQSRPLPLDALERVGVFVQNTSLPPDAALLSLAQPMPTTDGRSFAVVAEIKQDRLLRILGRSGPYTPYLVDRTGEVLVHPDVEAVTSHRDFSERPVVKRALEAPVRLGVHAFDDDTGTAQLAAYAKLGTGGLTALVEVPRAEALRASQELVRRSLWFGIAILLVGFLASLLLSRRLTGSILKLRDATRAIGRGEYDVPIDVRSGDEVGDLADAFRGMGTTLKETQQQLVRSEKMAAFGQLGAGITHEVKNPLTGIIGFSQLAQRKTQDPEKLKQMLGMIESEAKRCKEIVDNLLRFARAEPTALDEVDLRATVEAGLKLVRHQLGVHSVKLFTDLPEGLPPVEANAGQLQQVLLNLTLNAQQAMPNGGKVTVRARAEGAFVVLEVEDDGPGIPEEIRDRILDPFFTTKPAGEGTGLGLSVVYGIIRDHGGRLTIHQGGEGGALFRIELPAKGAQAAPPASGAAA